MMGKRQPLLSDAVITLCAPTQVWSARDGDIGASPIEGIYHGDTRFVRRAVLTCSGMAPEHISTVAGDATRVVFGSLLRHLDDATPDPKVRLLRERSVTDGTAREVVQVRSHVDREVRVRLVVRLEPEFASLHEVKAGIAEPREWTWQTPEARCGAASFALDAPGAEVTAVPGGLELSWQTVCPPRGSAQVEWSIAMDDPALVVHGVSADAGWHVDAAAPDPRVGEWVRAALDDLAALRLQLHALPGEIFLAAGAPWFLTLFGRDSLWAARLLLPVDVQIAASTLRVLASLQGTTNDPARAEEPGKILHELRAAPFHIPEEGVVLPPVYYGSVDATPLWVCLLADAWRAGMPHDEVRALVPALVAALGWITDYGDSDGDGFLDYIDRTGHGLANQGWKDSGDSIQWRDGTLAEGPIALCEVQAYAYEALMGGAELIETLAPDAGPSPHDLRAQAAALRTRFAETFWVRTPEGRYPAVALDRHKRPVDTLTSNIGHLLGTGILDPAEEEHVAALLQLPSMASGYGIRTMSTAAAGYWPLSYHGGSVWTHDTAIAVYGLLRAGMRDAARAVVAGMLDAAEGFAYRVPELHSGDAATLSAAPTPYPAACRPQAWSAAAAVTALEALRER